MRLRMVIILFICSLPLFGQNNINLMNKLSLAQSYENSGEPGKALKIYLELYQLNPTNNIYFESLNRIYLQLKNYAASIDLIEKEIVRRPKDINLYGLLGSSYYLMGNEEKAFNVWDEALSGNDNNPFYYRVIANYAFERRAFEKAIDYFRQGQNISSDKAIFSYDLARLYSLTMQYQSAAEEYCSILLSDQQQLSTVESKVFAIVNKPEALNAFISVVKKYDNKDNFSLLYLLARLYTETKDYERAFDIYKELDKKKSQSGAELYRYATSLFRMGEYKISKEVYESIIEMYPQSQIISSAKLGLAKSSEAILMKNYSEQLPLWKPFFKIMPYESDEIIGVINAFEAVAYLYKNSEAANEALLRIGMIKLYLQNNRKEAAKYFYRIINKTAVSTSIADAYNGLGEIALLEGNIIEAEKDYSQIINLFEKNIRESNDAKYKLARVKFYEGHFKQAQELLTDVLKNLKDDNANNALELSILLNTAKFDSSNLKIFAEAEFLTDQKKFSEAAKKYKLIAENQRAFLLHSIASLRLAEMQIANDDYQQAMKMLEKVIEEREKNIYADKALYLLAQLFHYGFNDKTKAIEKYEQLLVKFPSSIYTDKARTEIKKLKEKVS